MICAYRTLDEMLNCVNFQYLLDALTNRMAFDPRPSAADWGHDWVESNDLHICRAMNCIYVYMYAGMYTMRMYKPDLTSVLRQLSLLTSMPGGLTTTKIFCWSS